MFRKYIDIEESANKNIKHYNFDDTILQIDTLIERSRFHLDTQLLHSQLKANQSQIATNEISKTTNIYLAIFTFIGTIYSANEFLERFIPEDYLWSEYKSNIIDTVLTAIFLLGIIGYREIYLMQRRKDKTR